MKKICLLVATLLTGLAFMLHASDNDIITAKRLEDLNEYDMAGELLRDNLKSSFSENNVRLIIEFNQRILNRNAVKRTKSSISSLSIPDKDISLKDIAKGSALGTAFDMMSSPLGFPVGKVIGTVGGAIHANKKDEDNRRDIVRNESITLLDLDSVKPTLEEYEVAKKMISYTEKLLWTEIKKGDSNFNTYVGLKKEIDKQKNDLKNDRTGYLSYEIISPYLFEAEKQLFLADSNYLALKEKDKESLDNAVKAIAKACHNNWLYQSNEEVRMQFVKVQKKLKEIASETELEDYKVITTLEDCLDPSKKRGADAWME